MDIRVQQNQQAASQTGSAGKATEVKGADARSTVAAASVENKEVLAAQVNSIKNASADLTTEGLGDLLKASVSAPANQQAMAATEGKE